ncbi:MAG: hypothetical protein ACM3JD_04100, partial [Rudaea sp.]
GPFDLPGVERAGLSERHARGVPKPPRLGLKIAAVALRRPDGAVALDIALDDRPGGEFLPEG